MASRDVIPFFFASVARAIFKNALTRPGAPSVETDGCLRGIVIPAKAGIQETRVAGYGE